VRNIEETVLPAPSTYTVKLRFIDVSKLNVGTATLPPFFPQIPPDIFYPIFYKSEVLMAFMWATASYLLLL